MNTILYVSLTANGYVVQPDQGHPIPKAILANFRQVVQKTGNLINGRRTYELGRAGGALDALSHVAYVVVSHEQLTDEGVEVVASPEAALQYLEQKGFRTALVGGGAGLDSLWLWRQVEIQVMHLPEGPMKGPDILLYQECGIIKPWRSGCTPPVRTGKLGHFPSCP